ncbi:MAG: hypothetical protein GY938_20100, partial [Ketobacter sp.]|nr:hypothetical protein [Ketobacter sp.]
MKFRNTTILATALGSVIAFAAFSQSWAAEGRCRLYDDTRVICPVRSDTELEAAADAYEKEASQMASGESGSTYGVAPFDYLTGVGKRTQTTTLTKGDSGYGNKGGKTALRDRVT